MTSLRGEYFYVPQHSQTSMNSFQPVPDSCDHSCHLHNFRDSWNYILFSAMGSISLVIFFGVNTEDYSVFLADASRGASQVLGGGVGSEFVLESSGKGHTYALSSD